MLGKVGVGRLNALNRLVCCVGRVCSCFFLSTCFRKLGSAAINPLNGDADDDEFHYYYYEAHHIDALTSHGVSVHWA